MASFGIPQHPLKARDKAPILKDWPKRCSCDPAQIDVWEKEFPGCNFGSLGQLAVGKPFAFEVDSLQVKERFRKDTGLEFTPTRIVESSPGREHRWLLHTSESVELANVGQNAVIGQDFSVRAENEFCVSPGSIHPITGKQYRVAVNVPLAPISAKEVEWLKAQKTAENKSASSLANDDGPILAGSRDNTLASIAGKYRQKGFSVQEIRDLLAGINERRCQPPVSDEDLDRISGSIGRYKPGEPTVLFGGVPAGSTGSAPICTNGMYTPEQMQEKLKESEQQKQQQLDDYDDLIEQCQQNDEKTINPYPSDAWAGTPYLLFAQVGRGEGSKHQNYIPAEYLINTLMTYVGAICGNRVVPDFNQKLQARFITILLSQIGGIGKNEVIEWTKSLFTSGSCTQHRLLYDRGARPSDPIGCFRGSFGSARGMIQIMMNHPRVLQEYPELSTAIEKFGIEGSGTAFRDMILNLADGQTPDWSIIKNTQVPEDANHEVSNSVISGTTVPRLEEMMAKSNWETLIQRTNIIPTDETRTVFKLVVPDFQEVRSILLPRIQLLKDYRLVWDFSAEAEQLGEQWHADLQRRRQQMLARQQQGGQAEHDAEYDSEAVGRIQVYLHRILSHMALWLAPPPTGQEEYEQSDFTPDGSYISSGRKSRIWRFEITAEIMRKAIRVAEYQIRARRDNMPVQASNASGVVENLIKKWAFQHKQMRWFDLVRRGRIDRFGYRVCHEALQNLVRMGILACNTNPEDAQAQRDWVVVWVGSVAGYRWKENRGGKRTGAGRKKARD